MKAEPVSAPAAAGYSMPAEWAPHEATWLAWPHNVQTWPGTRLARVEDAFLRMIEALLAGEKVHLLVRGPEEAEPVLRRLDQRGALTRNLILHERPTVDAWIRDYGPTFVRKPDGAKAWVKWVFNAWGEKYSFEDNHVFVSAAGLVPYPCFEAGWVLEGGSIEVNGAGVCLTTEQCLLQRNRNPRLGREKIEQNLKDFLGVSAVVWLAGGIEGDDTDGHVDDVARFAAERVVCAAWEDDASDPNAAMLKRNWRLLEKAAAEKNWTLVKLPMPGKVADGGRLPASYVNFYIANRSVLVPAFGHPADERAAKILAELFPGRSVVAIPCRELVYGLGAIHCVTQQEPA